MAEAKKVQSDYSLQLTLCRREAEILQRLLGKICDGENGTDPIYDALEKAGVKNNETYLFTIKAGHVSTIEFSDLSNV